MHTGACVHTPVHIWMHVCRGQKTTLIPSFHLGLKACATIGLPALFLSSTIIVHVEYSLRNDRLVSTYNPWAHRCMCLKMWLVSSLEFHCCVSTILLLFFVEAEQSTFLLPFTTLWALDQHIGASWQFLSDNTSFCKERIIYPESDNTSFLSFLR